MESLALWVGKGAERVCSGQSLGKVGTGFPNQRAQREMTGCRGRGFPKMSEATEETGPAHQQGTSPRAESEDWSLWPQQGLQKEGPSTVLNHPQKMN